jgi:PhzF family phenazine biosynthesis protein
MGIKIFQVDAFTQEPFLGNPAAVCLLDEALDENLMQNIAREMNLSETAFLFRQSDGFSLRWFTPQVEVDLCGHATLASAHVLWEAGELEPNEQARFHTLSGLLSADKDEGLIKLNFPALVYEPATAPGELEEALGIEPIDIQKFGRDFLFEVASEMEVRQMKPDFHTMKTLPAGGVVVTSISQSEEFDFVSRFFAPWVGIDEDPVTGSVHCCLGPYWGKRLGKKSFAAYQASERGGKLSVELEGDRVILGGHAVTVLQGEITI